jgi:hypothetical protein
MEQSIRLERRFAIIDEWLLDLDISDRAVRLYAVLARYADSETHKAYPSRSTLAERLRCSKASVDRASQELVDAGAMTKKQRHNSSVIYTLQVSSPLHRGVITDDEGGYAPVTRGVLTGDDLTRTTELEPKEQEPLNDIKVHFNQFWSVYPKKQDKALAKRSFERALKRASFDDIMAGVEQYKNDPNRDPLFTKNPSTWLNADAWENDPLPAMVTRKPRKLTNAEEGFLLTQKYREQEKARQQEPKEITFDMGLRLKGVDDE